MNIKTTYLHYFLGTISLFLLVITTQSCEEEIIIPDDFLGYWEEYEDNAPAFAGRTINILFESNDEFELELSGWTDAISVNDPCGFSWTHYIKGTYQIDGTVINLTGKYTDDTFTTEQPNCNGATDYDYGFTYVFEDGDLILEQGSGLQAILIKQ